jgi:hypothetical protein
MSTSVLDAGSVVLCMLWEQLRRTPPRDIIENSEMRVGNCPQSLTERKTKLLRGIHYHISNIEVLCSVKQRKEFRIADAGLRPRVPH